MVKRILVKFAGGRCKTCGYNKSSRALSFHHVDPSTKSFTLDSSNLVKKSWLLILEEVEKCELLCANCHAKHHNDERSKSVKPSYVKNRNKYIRRKLELINNMGGKCLCCEYKFEESNVQVATFHHLNDKSFPLDSMAFIKKSDDDILAESKKCELLCFNCHSEKHDSNI